MSEIPSKKYDLEERTSAFGENTINFCKSLTRDVISIPLIQQIVRSATSIGANYREANGASSKNDFRNKIYICKKEANETKHWLQMLNCYYPGKKEQVELLRKECQEFILIFQKIISTLKIGNSVRIEK